MFSINFDLVNGYFYDSVITFPLAKDIVKSKSGNNKEASWFYGNNLVQKNINILLEHPSFSQLMKSRNDLSEIFINTGTDTAKNALEKLMNNIIDVLTSCLQKMHELYWLKTDKDESKRVRSQYIFDECLNNAISIAKTKFEVLNLISNDQALPSIESTLINRSVEDIIKNNTKKLGGKSESTIKKSIKSGSRKYDSTK